jgi:beta-1,4-mannosyltransferase
MSPMRVLAWPAFLNRFLNPYNWLLYTHMRRFGARVDEFSPTRLLRAERYRVWHLHWPDVLLNQTSRRLAGASLGILIRLVDAARRRGVKVVWTVHNLRAHEGYHPAIERWFWRAFTRRLDGYISLTETSRRAAVARFPALRDLPGSVVPHGHYRGVYPDSVTRAEARAILELPQRARVYLFIGHLRPYKSVPELVATFRRLADPRAVLVVAGRPNRPELRAEVERAAAEDPRVRLYLGFVPARRVQLYLRAADLVVLPYAEILNSGSSLLALSFDRPILVPAKGSLRELEAQVGADWVRTYEGPLDERALADGMRWALETTRAEAAPLEAFDWSAVAQGTLAAYDRICEASPSAAGDAPASPAVLAG